ncbi:MAG: 5-deoxy-glucuronate isomerase [Hyphomicrobiaceae bacterium]|nr:5-deoxy-glucuronate isomerase [Hyphomicrobiaceae bacterium]
MPHLRQRPNASNPRHAITPASAGWDHVGFELRDLAAGDVHAGVGEGRELCLVLVAGRARVIAGVTDFGELGERMNPFDGLPWSVYVPAGVGFRVEAVTPVELAICSAPATGRLSARLIPPADVGEETRGEGTNTRYVRNILPESASAESLLVVEVITPGGNWSSYPPHRHDRDDLPAESLLEETYYHRLRPSQGFGFQRVYTDDGTLDEAIAFTDRDVVLVPRGYHPVGAPHGYDLYYLNVMAGPKRTWKFHNDPAHAWIVQPK